MVTVLAAKLPSEIRSQYRLPEVNGVRGTISTKSSFHAIKNLLEMQLLQHVNGIELKSGEQFIPIFRTEEALVEHVSRKHKDYQIYNGNGYLIVYIKKLIIKIGSIPQDIQSTINRHNIFMATNLIMYKANAMLVEDDIEEISTLNEKILELLNLPKPIKGLDISGEATIKYTGINLNEQTRKVAKGMARELLARCEPLEKHLQEA